MEKQRRIDAYGVCRVGDRVLLARSPAADGLAGRWQLPGGPVGHAEDPAATVLRGITGSTAGSAGFDVEVTGLRAVVSDVVALPAAGVALHVDRIVYDLGPRAGSPAPPDGPGWAPVAGLPDLPLAPFTAEVLGLPPAAFTAPAPAGGRPAAPAAPAADRMQRFGAYGLVTDPAGRVLLAQIADGYPGAGEWHLPGGGTDHGEQPAAGLLREIAEETGQAGRVTGLLAVAHRHLPGALGPEGRPIDFHVVGALYRVAVDEPAELAVAEAAGGSTAGVAWLPPAEAATRRLSYIAGIALARLERRE
ncbi:MAG TPA: NUDIX domain-containing protein [Pilimelia sp.]|nr:NUDIX domain-containing protein [Pilimelia sp.]